MDVPEALNIIINGLELAELSVPDLSGSIEENISMRHFCMEVALGVNRLLERIQTTDRQTAEQRLRLVNLEQSLKNLQKRRTDEGQELERLRHELEAAQQQIVEREKTKASREEEQVRWEGKLQKLEEELEVARARNDRLESERVELLRSLERRQVEIDGLNEQAEERIGRLKELREEIVQRDGLVSELQGRLQSIQLQMRFAQEEATKQSQLVEWHRQELDRTREEFAIHRREKAGQLAEAQAQAEGLTARTAQLEEQTERLRTRAEQRERQLEEALERAKEAEASLAEREILFLQELQVKERLADVYKSAMEETTARLETAEEMLQAGQHMGERIREVELQHAQKLEEVKAELAERGREVEMLRRHLDELGGGGLVEPTTGSGTTYSQLYTEYARTKTSLLRAEKEAERLRECLANVCQDIEARVPALQAERKELERVKIDCQTLGEKLMTVSKVRDALDMQLREAQDRLRQQSVLEQQVSDLGMQVQHLLRTMESTGNVPDIAMSREQIGDNANIIDADQVINERLVVFRNIQELQVRNQELLRVVRELSSQQEVSELERLKAADGEMRSKLMEMTRELDELRETRQKQTTLVEALIRQRDMLRELVNRHGAVANLESSNLTNIITDEPTKESMTLPYGAISMEEFELFKREKEKLEERLTLQLEDVREQLTTAKTSVAQLKVQVEFHQERHELLRRTHEMERAELDALRRSNRDALESIMRHQSQMQGLMSDLVEAKEREGRLQGEFSRVRVELETLRVTEQRRSEELLTNEREKERLSNLLLSLQSLSREADAQGTSLKERLSRQVDVLEKELQGCRLRLAEEVEASRLATTRADREYREQVRRYDQLMEGYNRAKEELAQARITQHELQRKLSDQESLLARHEERLQKLMRSDIPAGESGEREVAAIRAKMASLEDELSLERQHLATYRDMARTAETNLADLSRTYDEYRSMTERRMSQLEEENRSGEEGRERLRADLTQAAETIDQLRQELRVADARHREEVRQLQHRLDELQQYEQMAQTHSALRKEDVERLQESLERTRQLYEAEVIAHGQDVEALRAAREQLGQLEERIRSMTEQLTVAQSTVTGHEEVLRREREQLTSERLDLEKRLADLTSQNNILLERLEQQHHQQQQQHKLSSTSPTTLPNDDLADVVAYLRRQKDVLQVEHDALTIEYRRVKSQAEHLQRSLDEHRAWLEEEKRANQWQSQMAADYAALLEKVEQIKVIRESNVTLRAENESLARRRSELEEEIKQTRERLMPLEEERKKLSAQLEVMHEEIRVIRDDRNHWKARYDGVLSQLSRVEEEGERARLQAELADLREQLQTGMEKEQELAAAKEVAEATAERMNQLEQKYKALIIQSRQIARTRDEHARRIAELEQQNPGSATTEAEVTNLKTALKDVTDERDRLNEQVTTLQADLATQQEKVNRLNEALKKVARMKEQFKTIQEQYRVAQTAQEASEQRLAEVRQEAELRTNLLQNNWQTRVNKLQDEVEKLRQRLEQGASTNTAPAEAMAGPTIATEKKRQKSSGFTTEPSPKVTIVEDQPLTTEEAGEVETSPMIEIVSEGGDNNEQKTMEKMESAPTATLMGDDDEEDEMMLGEFSELEEHEETTEPEVLTAEHEESETELGEHAEDEEVDEAGETVEEDEEPTTTIMGKGEPASPPVSTTIPSTTTAATATTSGRPSRVIDLSGIGRSQPSRTVPLTSTSASTPMTSTTGVSYKSRGHRPGRGGAMSRRARRPGMGSGGGGAGAGGIGGSNV